VSSLSTITPAELPLTVEQLKAHARITHAEEDDLVAAYLAAAAEDVAAFLGRAVGQTVYRLTLDRWPDRACPVLLPRPPVQSIDAVRYLDTSGDWQSIAPAELQQDLAREPARLLPAVGDTWPDTQQGAVAAVEIEFTAGDDAAVPQRALQAIRMQAAGLFEFREDLQTDAVRALPGGTRRLLVGLRFRSRELSAFLDTH